MPFAADIKATIATEIVEALLAQLPTSIPVPIAEGGTASATAAAARAALLTDAPWVGDLPEDGGNTTYVELSAPRAMEVVSVRVMVPVVDPEAKGTYLFDVHKGGVSVLTSTINLKGLTAGTWVAGELKTDGTELLTQGAELRVQAASDDAALTGFSGGVSFTIGLR